MRKIIHIDMDAFFASVEQRDHEAYKGKPLAVGGSPRQRGVVAAASYEARAYGIHSAMPSSLALQRCPNLILVNPRFDAYKAVSQQIREIFLEYTDLVEPLSLDEAYLDVTANKREMQSATLIAREIKKRIQEETNLTASAGVSINKFLAKTASGLDKPNGLFLIPPERAESFVEELAIDKFYGIGEVTAGKMQRLGIYKGADLKRWSESDLLKSFGKVGSYYYQIARGQDDRPVVSNRIRKSVGAEESYADDLCERDAIINALKDIAEILKARLLRAQTSGKTLTLKVKYSDYQQVTRSRTLLTSFADTDTMLQVAIELLDTTEVFEKNARLLGLTVSNLDYEKEESECTQLKIELDPYMRGNAFIS